MFKNNSVCSVEFEWFMLPLTANSTTSDARQGRTGMLDGLCVDDDDVRDAIVGSKQNTAKTGLKMPQSAAAKGLSAMMVTPARNLHQHQAADHTPVPASQFVLRRQDSNGVLVPVDSMLDYLLNPVNVVRCGSFSIAPARGKWYLVDTCNCYIFIWNDWLPRRNVCNETSEIHGDMHTG